MSTPQDPFATPGDDPSRQQSGQQPPPPPGYGQSVPESGQQPQGYGQPGYGQPAYGQPGGLHGPQKNGLGVASLVLGILSLFTWFFFIGGLFGLIAIVLGIIGLGRVKRGEANNRGMAIAGIITGALGVLLTILVVAGVAALFNSGEFSNLTECVNDAGGDQAAVEECTREFEDSVG
jgi:hypothetical protein